MLGKHLFSGFTEFFISKKKRHIQRETFKEHRVRNEFLDWNYLEELFTCTLPQISAGVFSGCRVVIDWVL